MPSIRDELMRSKIPKILALVGATIFGFSINVIFFTFLDWGPRTCTISGCPPLFSTEVILSYMEHGGASLALVNLLGLAMMLSGLRGLSKTRSRYPALCVLVGIIAYMVAHPPIFLSLLSLFFPPSNNVHSITTVTSTTTVRSP